MTRNQKDRPDRSRSVLAAAALVVFACVVSAGIHAALVPEHLAEMPLLGDSFILATLLLIGLGVALTVRPESRLGAALAALLFSGMTLAFVASRTYGLPVLEPEPEPVELIGILTVAVQVIGTLAALWLTGRATSQSSDPARAPDRARLPAAAKPVPVRR